MATEPMNVKHKLITMPTNRREALELITDAYVRLRNVPDEGWLVGDWTDEVNKCCFIGHYTRLNSDNVDDYSKGTCQYSEYTDALRKAFELAGMLHIDHFNDAVGADYDGYRQLHAHLLHSISHEEAVAALDTPKKRTMIAAKFAMDKLCRLVKQDDEK